MFATALTWLVGLLQAREPTALQIAADKRRLEVLLRAEGVSKAAAVRIVGAYFTQRGADGGQ